MVAIRVKKERLARGLSQNALAKQAGISTAVLFMLEEGRSQAPRLTTITGLAEALGVSIDWLCGRTEQKHAHLTGQRRFEADRT